MLYIYIYTYILWLKVGDERKKNKDKNLKKSIKINKKNWEGEIEWDLKRGNKDKRSRTYFSISAAYLSGSCPPGPRCRDSPFKTPWVLFSLQTSSQKCGVWRRKVTPLCLRPLVYSLVVKCSLYTFLSLSLKGTAYANDNLSNYFCKFYLFSLFHSTHSYFGQHPMSKKDKKQNKIIYNLVYYLLRFFFLNIYQAINRRVTVPVDNYLDIGFKQASNHLSSFIRGKQSAWMRFNWNPRPRRPCSHDSELNITVHTVYKYELDIAIHIDICILNKERDRY